MPWILFEILLQSFPQYSDFWNSTILFFIHIVSKSFVTGECSETLIYFAMISGSLTSKAHLSSPVVLSCNFNEASIVVTFPTYPVVVVQTSSAQLVRLLPSLGHLMLLLRHNICRPCHLKVANCVHSDILLSSSPAGYRWSFEWSLTFFTFKIFEKLTFHLSIVGARIFLC